MLRLGLATTSLELSMRTGSIAQPFSNRAGVCSSNALRARNRIVEQIQIGTWETAPTRASNQELVNTSRVPGAILQRRPPCVLEIVFEGPQMIIFPGSCSNSPSLFRLHSMCLIGIKARRIPNPRSQKQFFNYAESIAARNNNKTTNEYVPKMESARPVKNRD